MSFLRNAAFLARLLFSLGLFGRRNRNNRK